MQSPVRVRIRPSILCKSDRGNAISSRGRTGLDPVLVRAIIGETAVPIMETSSGTTSKVVRAEHRVHAHVYARVRTRA